MSIERNSENDWKEGLKDSYLGIKCVTDVVPLNQPSLGYEIHFEDVCGFDEAENLKNYQSLKESIESLSPNVRADVARCQEGVISFEMVDTADMWESTLQKQLQLIQSRIIEALECGHGLVRLEDICEHFCRAKNPWFWARRHESVTYWIQLNYSQADIKLGPGVLELKINQINSAAKGAFTCELKSEHSAWQLTLHIDPDHPPKEYFVTDAIREIVELLEASCPENRRYDPDYARQMAI